MALDARELYAAMAAGLGNSNEKDETMSFQETWANASTEGSRLTTPHRTGCTTSALVDAGAFTSKQGNDVAKLEFQTVDKQHQWTMILGFGSPKQAGFSKATCMKVGVNVDDVSSLEELDTA
jgi:hypothetical protein